MNTQLFQQAQTAYAAKDYATALQTYIQCLSDTSCGFLPGESGQLCHQMGNCFMQLGNAQEAINAYTQAVADPTYDAVGSVQCNLGTAYASLRDYANAIVHFDAALADPRYDARYKASLGKGNALMKLGKTAEAGVAFREAALDERNPNPTKALLNLGICFMTLNRPADAVTSYESALQFSMDASSKNKLYANLGQAYVACGQMQKAVHAFETALADQTYFLSDSASVDYQRAIGAVSQGTMEINQVHEPVFTQDSSGFDVVADDYNAYEDEYDQDYIQAEGGYLPSGDEADDRFFMASEEELEAWSKSMAKERKHRHIGLKLLIVLFVLILALLGVGFYGYTQGYGYPMQEDVITEFFANPADSRAHFTTSTSDSDYDAITKSVVASNSVQIDGMNKTMSTTVAYVTVQTQQGGSVHYEVILARDGIAWKISDVEMYFVSQL